MYRLQRLAVFSFCCIFPWLCTSFFEFLHSYLWIVAIVPKQLEVYLRSTGLGLEVFPFTSFTASELHALCWSLWFIWILNRVWGRDVVFLYADIQLFQTFFTEEAVFPPMCLCYFFVKNEMAASVCVCIWILYSTLLICMAILCWYHVVFVIILL